jgi:mono/diheme cytochrome c family protein
MKIRTTLTVAALFMASTTFAEEATYTKNIRGIFEKHCADCHGSTSPEYPAFKKEAAKWTAEGKGPRMDTYAHLIYYTAWPDTGALMRRLDDGKGGQGGKPGNMYTYLGDSDEERQKNFALFKSWVGGWVLKRLPDITKEEILSIRVPY